MTTFANLTTCHHFEEKRRKNDTRQTLNNRKTKMFSNRKEV